MVPVPASAASGAAAVSNMVEVSDVVTLSGVEAASAFLKTSDGKFVSAFCPLGLSAAASLPAAGVEDFEPQAPHRSRGSAKCNRDRSRRNRLLMGPFSWLRSGGWSLIRLRNLPRAGRKAMPRSGSPDFDFRHVTQLSHIRVRPPLPSKKRA